MYQVVVMYGDNEPWWFLRDGSQIFKRRSHLQLSARRSHFMNKNGKKSERVFVHKCKIKLYDGFLE